MYSRAAGANPENLPDLLCQQPEASPSEVPLAWEVASVQGKLCPARAREAGEHAVWGLHAGHSPEQHSLAKV